MKSKVIAGIVLMMLLLVVVSPIGVSVGVVDFDGESGDFMAQSGVDWWPIPNGDFEKDPAGTSFNDISDWNYSIIVQKGNPPTGDDLQIVDDYYFNGTKSLYSYLKTTSVGPSPGDSWVSQVLSTEEPVSTTADYISLWIGGDGYTTSSRYYWSLHLILTDGTNTHAYMLRCDNWDGTHYNYYNATETGADGNTWKRYTRRIPDSIEKSNLTIKINHHQRSWDLTTASSWYRLDNICFSDSGGNPRADIETKTVNNLPSGEETIITFTWDTTGVAPGNYTITAYAHPVPGETDTDDNTYIDGWVLVILPGDLNDDGRISIADCKIMDNAYSGVIEEPRADLNCDGRVSIADAKIMDNIYSGV